MKWFYLNPVDTHCAKHCLNARETAMPTDRPPIDSSNHPLVLVAEDDGPSGQFFISALQDMRCRVDLATTGQQALELARNTCYGLLLLDCHMPDFGAIRILSALREDAVAASHACPAIATSAELDPVEQAHFRQTGFADALLKPVSLETLRQSVKTWLPAMPSEPVLDDNAAIANSGSAASVAALRELFIRELSRLLCELDQLAQNGGLSETLHRLLASCGFCGANALAAATARLKRQLDTHAPVAPADMQQFRDTLSTTLDALTQARNAQEHGHPAV